MMDNTCSTCVLFELDNEPVENIEMGWCHYNPKPERKPSNSWCSKHQVKTKEEKGED